MPGGPGFRCRRTPPRPLWSGNADRRWRPAGPLLAALFHPCRRPRQPVPRRRSKEPPEPKVLTLDRQSDHGGGLPAPRGELEQHAAPVAGIRDPAALPSASWWRSSAAGGHRRSPVWRPSCWPCGGSSQPCWRSSRTIPWGRRPRPAAPSIWCWPWWPSWARSWARSSSRWRRAICPHRNAARGWLLALSLLAVVPLLALLRAGFRAESLGGLDERIFLALELAWILVTALTLARRRQLEVQEGTSSAG